jgi:plastocyanin
MRAIFFSFALGAATLGLVVQAQQGVQAAGDHNHGSGRSSGAKMHYLPGTKQTAVLIPVYPTTEPYRSAFFFPESARAERERDVRLSDNYFSPSILWVQAGTKVRFTNDGKHTHTVTCDTIWESGEMKRGDSFSLIFTRAGTYYYYCRHHTKWMRGTITVY